MPRLELPGLLDAAAARRTAEFIAAEQLDDGAIPWFRGEGADPWDHVEAAMALSASGLLGAARAGYRWLAATQRPDGSWPMRTLDGVVLDAAADTNQCAYLAVGLWHHWLVCTDRALIAELWPTLRAALGFVLDQQRPDGAIGWAVAASGAADTEALLAGNASIYQALRCGLRLADLLEDPQPGWELAAGSLRHALLHHPGGFADRSRYSMDWYYPLLGGGLRGAAAALRLRAGWSRFVQPGWGVRCVADHDWATGAETCELVLALDACGRPSAAAELFAAVQHLRHDDGGYWTGYVLRDHAVWPEERTTWTAAAVLLAADALSASSGGYAIFRDSALGPHPAQVAAGCCTALAR